MAKKSRRARSQAPRAPKSVRISRTRALAPQPDAQEVDFPKEYKYVVEDLKRIFIIALALLALLVVLAVAIG
ncbi:MAG: hypothetical protein ACP5JJ_16075 [Anaerolineae bacterium]